MDKPKSKWNLLKIVCYAAVTKTLYDSEKLSVWREGVCIGDCW